MSKLGRLWVVSSFALVVACGGSQKPNPLPPEEPMDKNGGSATTDSTPTTTAASTDAPASDSSAADPSAGLGDPSATAAATPAPATADDGKGKGKGKGNGKTKGGKGELSKAECDQIADHEMDVVIASSGMDPSMKEMLKAQGGSAMANLNAECLKSGTRAQYKCMMAAQSKDEMSKCDNL